MRNTIDDINEGDKKLKYGKFFKRSSCKRDEIGINKIEIVIK